MIEVVNLGLNSDNEKTRSPKSLEEKLLEEVLIESAKAHPAPGRIRAIALEQYGATSPNYKYIDEQLKRMERHLDLSTWLLEKLSDLLADTAIIGKFSKKELARRFLAQVERLGLDEARRLLALYEANALPENVIPMSKYREKQELERLFGLNGKPKGAA